MISRSLQTLALAAATGVSSVTYRCRSVGRRRWWRLRWGIQRRCKRSGTSGGGATSSGAPSAGAGGPTSNPSNTATGGCRLTPATERWDEPEQCRGRSGDARHCPTGHDRLWWQPSQLQFWWLPGRVLGLPAPLATRPVSATSDRKPRRSGALRSRVTRQPRAFATGADSMVLIPGGETGQVDCRYAAYEPPSRSLKTFQQRKIKTRRTQ